MSVLEQVIFTFARIFESFGNRNNVSRAMLFGGQEVLGRIVEHLRLEPAKLITFVGREIAGAIAVEVVASCVEHVKIASCKNRLVVVCVVDIGQAKDVSELVTEGADTIELPTINLAGASIVAHFIVLIEVA